MNKQNFLNIVRDPTSMGGQDIAGLEEVVANFPFCQVAHLLIAKGSRDFGSMHAEQKLKKAAAYCLDRKKFKEVIQRDKKTEKSITDFKEAISVKPAKELPTVDDIIAQKTNTSVPKRKYEEIEENLKLIELFRSEANKKSTEAETLIPENTDDFVIAEIEKQPSDFIIASDTTEKEKENPEESLQAEPLPHAYIYSSRLEDVFLQELEIDSVHHKSEADLLLNYLEYIYENKLGKMRDKKKQQEIIEKFITADPVIPALKPNELKENQEDLASQSGKINKNPVSETFAKILALQGKKDKAIEIYEQLMLKFPEKKPYFAAEIEKLKK